MIKNRLRRAFTIVEIISVLLLVSLALTILYQIFYGLMFRSIAVQKRAEGQQAVRLLLVRLRFELKRAVATVQIEKSNQLLKIPLEDRTRKLEDPERFYFSEYEYLPERKDMLVRKVRRDGKTLEERFWLGGNSQIFKFKCYDTGENERILFQYYRVIVELEHYEVKMRDTPGAAAGPENAEAKKRETIKLTTTVYPRRVNMEQRIEVPQEGGSGL